jgi:hypothetical protein
VIKVFVALHRSLARCHSFRTSELYLSINLGAFYRCWLLAAGCWKAWFARLAEMASSG